MSNQMIQCEHCQETFGILRRKKKCDLCGQLVCSKCAPRPGLFTPSNTPRACPICLLITNEHTTSEQLTSVPIKNLRAYLIHSKIVSTNQLETYFEKKDLIDLIQLPKKGRIGQSNASFVRESNLSNTQALNNNARRAATTNTINVETVQESAINTNEQASTEDTTHSISPNESEKEITEESIPTRNLDRVLLDDISSLESINDLSIRQLKTILIQNYVSITGCVEKNELIHKVELLYRDRQQQKEPNLNTASEQLYENLCKICMDANIDCVFLNCGHLCTCVSCGKRLSECPLCRSYIIRVVRVFKS